MTFVIAQPCVGEKDTSCVTVGPFECIHPTKAEAGFAAADMLHIDPDTCTSCGLCRDECPVNAIFPDDELPTEWAEFIDRNAAFYRR